MRLHLPQTKCDLRAWFGRSTRPRTRTPVADEAGFTLPELMTTMAILAIVLAGITGPMVEATKYESDLNVRFQAQEGARVALSSIRRELHCASAVSPSSGSTSSITLTMPAGCTTGTGSVVWCTVASGGAYGLWRVPGTSCNTATSGSRLLAQSLTTQNVFTPDATAHAGAPVLPDVGVDLTVGVGGRSYRLTDTVYLRNGTRQ
jgi:prepilin-type N-terminal cleavage/methylation domain-containing protein